MEIDVHLRRYPSEAGLAISDTVYLDKTVEAVADHAIGEAWCRRNRGCAKGTNAVSEQACRYALADPRFDRHVIPVDRDRIVVGYDGHEHRCWLRHGMRHADRT